MSKGINVESIEPKIKESEIKSQIKSQIKKLLTSEETIDYLFGCAQSGKLEELKRLINLGADPNSTCKKWDGSLLEHASINNHLPVVHLLLASGANINFTKKRGHTINSPINAPLLFSVVLYCNIEIVKTLVDAGVDVNARNSNGKTALQYAKENGRDDIVQYLTPLNTRDENTYTLAKETLDKMKTLLSML